MRTNRGHVETGTSLVGRPTPTLAAVITMALLGACGGPADDVPVVCEQVKLLQSADLNGGVTLPADCYAVESQIAVSDGLLKLEPGVSITFGADAGLSFSGTGALSAVGTETAAIVLSGSVKQRGHWKGLHFNGSNSPENKLTYVELSHAGSAQWHGGGISKGGIFLQGGANRLHVSNSTFRQNAQAGIVAESGDADFKLESTHFDDNEAPLWIHSNLIGNLSSLTFANNDDSFIRTGLVTETVSTAQTWPAFEVPYRSTGALKLDAVLTLAPGVTLEFVQGKGMEVSGNGRLTARGTAEKMITLTGAEKQRGYWSGLYFYESRSSANVLEHVVVEYAGSNKWHGGDSQAGVFVRGDGVALKVSHSVFHENAVAGLYADKGGAELVVEATSFSSNALPLWIASNLIGNVAGDNTFADNDASYILASVGGTSGGAEVSTPQTWAAQSVPYRVPLTITVKSDLKLSSGVSMEFAQNAGLLVEGGTLAADGTDGDRITFTAADGETVRGYWKGIAFINSLSSKNVIANADILYAGGGKWHGGDSTAGIFVRGGSGYNSTVSLSDVKIQGSGKYGILVEGGSSVDPCDAVTFVNNVADDTFGAGSMTCSG